VSLDGELVVMLMLIGSIISLSDGYVDYGGGSKEDGTILRHFLCFLSINSRSGSIKILYVY